jgi:hypothetical protein
MATKTKNPYVGKGSAGNNDGSRRAKTAKEGKCQWCHTKVPLEEQFVVFNDFEKGKTIKSKNAAKPGREKLSHYCDDCATKRQKIKQAGDFDKASGKPRGRKPGGANKKKAVAKKAPAKAKSAGKKAGKRKVVRRKKAAASTSGAKSDPF